MRKIGFIILLFLFCGFNLSAQTKLTQEEYDVYATVLKGIYEENRETYSNQSHFVILDTTKVDPKLKLDSSRRYRNLVKDFKLKNSTSGIVEKKFPRGAYSETYYLLSQSEIDELFEKGRIEAEKRRAAEKLNSSVISSNGPDTTWIPFFQKYPESSGLHILSRVGFNGQFAMVQVKGERSWNGFSRTYILKRVKSGWRIIVYSGSEWT